MNTLLEVLHMWPVSLTVAIIGFTLITSSISFFFCALSSCMHGSDFVNGDDHRELLTITRHCGVDRVVLYAPFLSSHIRNAKDSSPEVLECRQIIYTGVALNPEEEQWGEVSNGLPITVRSFLVSGQLIRL